MTPLTLLLVLTAAVIHACWNLWIKQIGHLVRGGTLMWLLTAISSVLYAPLALIVFSRGTWRPEPVHLLWVAGSGVIHVIYFLLLIRGYRAGDLSVVYPVARGTAPLLAASAAVFVFAERPTPLSVTGAALIVAGVFVLTWRTSAAARNHLGPAFRYGLATGALIAVYTLWDGWSVKRVGIPPLLFYWGGEVVRVLLFTPTALADRAAVASTMRAHFWRVAGIAVLSPLSYILVLIALRTGPVSHIAPAREISILIGAFLGGHVLGEGQRRRRLIAAAAFAGGVIALALS